LTVELPKYFLTATHVGSPLEALARDCAIVVSIALQHGAPLETIRDALTKEHDGSPATLLGSAIDAMEQLKGERITMHPPGIKSTAPIRVTFCHVQLRRDEKDRLKKISP
jgi:hypothetical protein